MKDYEELYYNAIYEIKKLKKQIKELKQDLELVNKSTLKKLNLKKEIINQLKRYKENDMNQKELEQAFNETTDNAVKLLEENKEQKREIERLKNREQECIDHYLVQSKYASEMEDKYIIANNIINELNYGIKELDDMFYETFRISQNGYYSISEWELKDFNNKLQELKGSSNNE